MALLFTPWRGSLLQRPEVREYEMSKDKPHDEREGNGTKFTLDRKLFSSDIWFASPWKLKIWIYLIGKANHAPKKVGDLTVQRGQLLTSYRTIANDCAYKIGYRVKKPTVSMVHDICEEFTKAGRTVIRSEHTGTLITLCNYSRLQPMRKREANTEANSDRTVTELNKNDKNEKKKKRTPFIPPTPEQAAAYAARILFKEFDEHQFCDYYETRGWMLGKVKMKDWRAAVRTWHNNHKKRLRESGATKSQYLNVNSPEFQALREAAEQ